MGTLESSMLPFSPFIFTIQHPRTWCQNLSAVDIIMNIIIFSFFFFFFLIIIIVILTTISTSSSSSSPPSVHHRHHPHHHQYIVVIILTTISSSSSSSSPPSVHHRRRRGLWFVLRALCGRGHCGGAVGGTPARLHVLPASPALLLLSAPTPHLPSYP